jgi:hypothetical protein
VGLKKSSTVLESLNAYISDREQINHHLWLLHGDLLHNLAIADPVTEVIYDLNVLDVQDSVSSVAEMFHVVSEAFIMLLLDYFQGVSYRWTFICTLEVPDEHGTQLVPGVDRSLRKIDKPRSGHVGQCCGQIVSFYLIVSFYDLDDHMIDLDELFRIAGPILFIDVPGFELL